MSITEVYINTEQVNIYNQSTRQLIAEITVGTVNTTNTLEQEIANARHAKTVHRFLKKGIQKLEANDSYSQGFIAGLAGQSQSYPLLHQGKSHVQNATFQAISEAMVMCPDAPKGCKDSRAFIKGWDDGYNLRRLAQSLD